MEDDVLFLITIVIAMALTITTNLLTKAPKKKKSVYKITEKMKKIFHDLEVAQNDYFLDPDPSPSDDAELNYYENKVLDFYKEIGLTKDEMFNGRVLTLAIEITEKNNFKIVSENDFDKELFKEQLRRNL